ncbi:protein-export chaperone SecB [Flavobacterium sp. CYK-55]|uniref:protein-export chaperone SecB n=1 Tax=Flavobacterium sp. CYK-55 TaxID=2835529 RepID=UPI001BCF497B|nr:protein-export chaperone SecB [Flavobacterium sp. CYK-55]MBS7787653.1 protein-export chaperone SecB [Flavobacterium sp. CYK-55]
MSERAVFQLNKYYFNSVKIDLDEKKSKDVNVEFNPSGVFNTEKSEYELKITFSAYSGENKNEFIRIVCIAIFGFDNVSKLEEVPSFFYRNSIAILFPYLRAFVSTVTLQANIPPMVLPTYNLSELEKPLKENTISK